MHRNSWREDDEEVLWRDRPDAPYVPHAGRLMVPTNLLDATYEFFADYHERGVESGCFWYGERHESEAFVKALVVPKQMNYRGHYHVTAAGVEEVAHATRRFGWKNLAQLHTHPGLKVEHSRYDDRNAVSRRSLSFVFPYYGLKSEEWPSGIGVHEFQSDYWHLLDEDTVGTRVILTSDEDGEVVDLR